MTEATAKARLGPFTSGFVSTPMTLLRSTLHHSRRWLSATSAPHAITQFKMPAMSPTMTEGGIASWKKREGESFTAGDVLLEIETDKAVIDVEAQDDGFMGKILVQDGQKNIPVGKVIALLAEEGDDISNIEVSENVLEDAAPASKQEQEQAPAPPQSASTPTPSPKATHRVSHSRPLFPSVARLLQEYGVHDPGKIKGTGIRGMLTKGDVLAFLGKASSPTGTFKQATLKPGPGAPQVAEAKVEKPLDGLAIRQLIVQSMSQTAAKTRAAAARPMVAEFDSLIADYLPPTPTSPARTISPLPLSKPTPVDFLDGLV
ncbi:pyruvate dehydrogenase X component [Russula earlei]|uniref:Pyruvate dehydrogenase X component n=1 Tax=Russula earlei TaxID=71964 RepID=A0ACC0UJ36_9AGAM|nr:pyruvate dehydrogenase X component [Russula earlei]